MAVVSWIAFLPACGPGGTNRERTAEVAARAVPEPVLARHGTRTVAFTVDDLPASRDGTYRLEQLREVTTRLLDELQRANIEAVGFVNERKLQRFGQVEARTALLDQWLDAGMQLGNHTYSHFNFWDTPLAVYERDVLRGEEVTRRLLAQRGHRPRYFRHPYLNTGPTLAAKQAFERFLAEHGYTVAPVTIDNLDVLYALAYDNAYAARDTLLMRRLATAYIDHMEASFGYFEGLSRRVLRREPAQILLLHANALNADQLPRLIAMLRARGYAFVPLDVALQDSAYGLPDRYIGARGLSWLQRWAVSRGIDPGSEPRAPQWVQRAAHPAVAR